VAFGFAEGEQARFAFSLFSHSRLFRLVRDVRGAVGVDVQEGSFVRKHSASSDQTISSVSNRLCRSVRSLAECGLKYVLVRTRPRTVLAAVASVCALSGNVAFAQGALVNGSNHAGSISTPGEVDTWTFSAIKGAGVSLRVAEVDPVSTAFVPWIRLRDPNGAQVASNYNYLVGAIEAVAQLTGTYTVEITSADVANQGTGAYLLTLATGPADFIVPNGDEGGPMINGANHEGTIHRGDLDQWTFTAIQGAAISLRVGEVDPVSTAFVPWIQLRDPNGVPIGSGYNYLVGAIEIVAPLTGTYRVVIASGDVPNEGTGHYLLTLATGPGTFTVPTGDEGGPMTNGVTHSGAIHRGDLDQWTFWAVGGTALSLTVTEQTPASPEFVPWIRLRDPNGVQVVGNAGVGPVINYVPLVTGKYTVVVASGDVASSGTGNYTLRASGIQDPPQITLISPNRVPPGQGNISVAITGSFTHFVQGYSAANFGAGVTTVSTTVVDATHAVAVISVHPNAPLGPRHVTVTTGGTSAETVTAPNAFFVVMLLAQPAADFDGDGKVDVGIYRRSNGLWAIIQSGGGSKTVGWGDPGSRDVPVPADYDGDGKADVAVYRQSTGEWFIIRSTNNTLLYVAWGAPSLGDVPVPADYDGDGKADISVYRISTGEWFIIRSSNSTLLQVGWGTPPLGDVPVPADYDGDGKADIAVHRQSTGEWFIIRSSNSTLLHVGWGAPTLGDIPVVGDYDGDGKADVAVYRLSTGEWFVIRSSNSTLLSVSWGAPSLGDIPVPGDYDGDGKIDVGVYRTTTGGGYIIKSTTSTLLQVGWGSPGLGDLPPQYR